MPRHRSHYRIQIRKEALKFSAAHMTVFADGTKERLHGHNYRTQVTLKLTDFSLEKMLPFSDLKQAMRAVCESWDEHFFLPLHCPYLEILRKDEIEIEFRLCGSRYIMPIDEVIELSVDNVTTESLAAEFSRQLLVLLKPEALKNRGVTEVEVLIEEITGQGAAFVQELE